MPTWSMSSHSMPEAILPRSCSCTSQAIGPRHCKRCCNLLKGLQDDAPCGAGRVRGLKGHRWLIAACETKILMTDLVSRATREVPRAVLDGRAPTSLAFLYKCSPILLGTAAASPLLFLFLRACSGTALLMQVLL